MQNSQRIQPEVCKTMAIIEDLKDRIKHDKSLVPIIDDYLSQPVKDSNPLISIATKLLSEEAIRDGIKNAICTYVPRYIRDSQEMLQILNTLEGRSWLHSKLDDLLEYLTSERYRGTQQYICGICKHSFTGKLYKCPNCNNDLIWRF